MHTKYFTINKLSQDDIDPIAVCIFAIQDHGCRDEKCENTFTAPHVMHCPALVKILQEKIGKYCNKIVDKGRGEKAEWRTYSVPATWGIAFHNNDRDFFTEYTYEELPFVHENEW